jgi:hypothetical protein
MTFIDCALGPERARIITLIPRVALSDLLKCALMPFITSDVE